MQTESSTALAKAREMRVGAPFAVRRSVPFARFTVRSGVRVLRLGLQFAGEVDLAGDFDEAAGRIQMMAGGVLGHRFDHGVGETFAAKIVERVLDQLAAQTAIAEISGDGQIRNASFAGFAVNHGRDVADDMSFGFGDENAGGIGRNIFVDVTSFAPAPVVAVENAERLLDVFLERDTGE